MTAKCHFDKMSHRQNDAMCHRFSEMIHDEKLITMHERLSEVTKNKIKGEAAEVITGDDCRSQG